MSYLDELAASRRADVERLQREVPLELLKAKAIDREAPRDFGAALRRRRPAVIAEIKRASPSAGAIAPDIDPGRLAAAYERAGAAALSVLTEPRWFKGSLDDLVLARRVCALPVLRKDFVVDEYQVWEAAAAGADAILLIVAALHDAQLRSFLGFAKEAGMAALVEVHDRKEARRAQSAGATLIGINNRDLRTFEVRRSTALELSRQIKSFSPDVLLVAESGYTSAADLAECAAAGIDAVLIGEHLMRAHDPEAALRDLVAVRPHIKICGMQSAEEVEMCVEAGADALGFIFADSPRRLDVAGATSLTARVPPQVACVGVFANSPRALIEDAIRSCRLDLLQFSGDESPEFCGSFGVPTILVAHDAIPDAPALQNARAVAVMADARVPGRAGGTGVRMALAKAQRMRAEHAGHFILAGGLRPNTVGEAIRAVLPDGVDVRSGVEVNGVKDAGLVNAFVAAAKEALHART
ncbi:MAG TPA: indole-3-glycerol phosphate synthase TrpC [Candidatus Tumulicola sp.]|nr:indole-3-glycerol phosphate synthase TrpC [Candidatus Tumulicola sp.]